MPTKQELLELFEYKNGHLYWTNKKTRVQRNKPAGTVTREFYHKIWINGRAYPEHNIIWKMFRGEIERGLEIDHIDRNRANNNLENLRVVTKSINQRNKNLDVRNTSGVQGVWYEKKSKRWRASISIEPNKRIKIGCYKNKIDAVKARKEAEAQYGYIS